MIDDQRIALKFSPPAPPPGFVQRLRLADQVAKGLSGRLILLVAPMGFGKTSLLSSVAREWSRYSNASAAASIAWYSLDPSDNDTASFVDGLVNSVRCQFPQFGKSVRALLHSTTDARGQINNLLTLFKDELQETVDGEIAIVLDGFHFVTDVAIIDTLDVLLRDPESSIKWIIATQSYPRFYLSPLRSRDGLVELRDDDLRFTFDEVRELLLARDGVGATTEAVAEVVRYSAGWPSAAYLLSLIAARDQGAFRFERLFPTQHGYARIVREVVSRLPPQYREAALRSSLLSYLDPHSCREALGLADAEGFLRAIQDAALPVTKPSNREGPLIYDPLFRSALEQELSKKLLTHEYRQLKCKVALYYAEKGDRSEAIRGFLAAGANEEAAEVMEKALAVEVEEGHIDLVLGWLKALPVFVRQQHPRLLIQEARLLLSRKRLDEARVLLTAARPGLEEVGDGAGMRQLLASWAALYILDGRYKDARRSAEEALKMLPDADAADAAELFWLLSRSLELLGDVREAFDEGSRGLLAAEQSGRQPLVVRAMLQLGHLAYQRGDYGGSLALNGQAVQRSALMGTEMPTLALAGGTASSAYLAQGQIPESVVVAARSLEVSRQYGDTAAAAGAGLALSAASDRLSQVELPEAKKTLSPLIGSKKPDLAAPAQDASAGVEMRVGGVQKVRLLWPGLAEGDNGGSAELLIRAFGQFEAFVEGEHVEWPSSDARNLAAYLLVNRGRPVTKEEVMEKLWLNSEPAYANVRLHKALYSLRETLGPGYPPVDPQLESRRKLLWDGIGCSIDVVAFEDGVDRARQRLEAEKPPVLSGLTIALLEEVVGLYRGAFMANVDFDWCRPAGAELRRRFLWAARLLVFHYMAVRDWDQALQYGRRSLAVDPLQEEIVRQMMICHHRIGDRDAVFKQYRDLEWYLAKKRGAWLSDETRNLRLQLLGM